jgi:hypothetical protein
MMRALPMVLLLGACATENPDLVIERQPAPLAQVTDAGWKRGSVIIAAEPGTFAFPQPLSLRITIVDDATLETPTAELISRGAIELAGSGAAEVTTPPVCQPTFCTAEVSITAMGEAMLAITADGPAGGERDCFYYATVDTSADTDALRATLETRQRECRFMAE